MAPTVQDHLDQAQHNESFLNDFDLLNTAYRDWAFTVVFYAAVHYIDAFLLAKNQNPANHGQRLRAISQDADLSLYYKHYRHLYDDSREVRYECYRPSKDEVQQAITRWLNPLSSHVKARLGAS
jgi:uncharacterized protein (UPF0332 family)